MPGYNTTYYVHCVEYEDTYGTRCEAQMRSTGKYASTENLMETSGSEHMYMYVLA